MTDTHTSMPLSIVLAVHDQENDLEQNLPHFLKLAEELGYEVVVVDDASTDRTPDILKRIKSEHACLYTTFLPRSSVQNPSRLRLALSIGVKATHHSRIVLAHISRPPLSAQWLEGMAEGDAEAVMVYSGGKSPDQVHILHQYFDQLEEARKLILKAERQSGRGHRGQWLKYRRGLYDAIAVSKERVFDAVKYYDQPVSYVHLMVYRISVIWNNLFN